MKQGGDALAAAPSRLSLVALAAAVGAAVLTVPFAAALISVIRLWDWNFSRFSDDLIGLGMFAWLTLSAVALVLGIVQLLRRGHRRRMPVVAAALGAASLLVIVPLAIAANRSPSYRIEPGPPLAASPGEFVAALELHGFLVTSADGGATWDRNVLGAQVVARAALGHEPATPGDILQRFPARLDPRRAQGPSGDRGLRRQLDEGEDGARRLRHRHRCHFDSDTPIASEPGGQSVTRGLSNKRIEQNARRSAANRHADRVCSCAVRWAYARRLPAESGARGGRSPRAVAFPQALVILTV